MSTAAVSPELVRVALGAASGTVFETFANAYFAPLFGTSFVPLGGVADGGADAWDGGLFADEQRSDVFYQSSIEKDHRGKIRRTAKRLGEVGRTPRQIVLLTPHHVRYIDREEADLTQELDITIRIRDGGFITAHINDTDGTRAAFEHHLRHYTDYLRVLGSSRRIPESAHVKSPAAYVFLAQEVERRSGHQSLVDAVTDALALWGLEGTDPDAGILRTAPEVMARITEAIPTAASIIEGRLEPRLVAMSRKDRPGGRAVRRYVKSGEYCLPWETRESLLEENANDAALVETVLEGLEDRALHSGQEVAPATAKLASRVALRALQYIFETEGLEFARFLEADVGGTYPTAADSIAPALDAVRVDGRVRAEVADAAFAAVRGVLYSSSESERSYLNKLAKTYAIMFTLNTEPRLVRFFQEMTSDFRLYVGSDQLILAMSESYLEPGDRSTTNMLRIAAEIGAKVILTESAVEEVVSHLRACDLEYQNHLSRVSLPLGYEFIREVPHILLRAYLYANANFDLGARRPKAWNAFLNGFCSPETVHRSVGQEDIRSYLQNAFGLEYESEADLLALVDEEAVELLAMALQEHKKTYRLAYNDALVALAVYGRRNRRRERSLNSEFGWSTWWLTGETRILQFTRDVVRQNGGRYMMRPDFLLNYAALAPSAAGVREAFAGLFPSILGVHLGGRMPSGEFHKLIDKVEAAERLEPARRAVEMAKLSDKLKSDFGRSYAGTRVG
ncbi:hypothetical protein ICW40_03415 [Actinotalea ferrariae]|uniref:hypothetical protein n=1 Tax=Actinotalea ferrariae TaxID=1386098 RepID=UPI001C8B52D6|nr:hypothetical protein [Actinotalea ferrariae]MBX9243853.1 hypothetical protein [Actinotalea ferrariae]